MSADLPLRVPPNDTAAEEAVLGALMSDPSSLVKIADWVAEDDFYRKDHRLIWRAITQLIERKVPVDSVTLGDWFEANDLADMVGGPGRLSAMENNTPSAANIVAYAEIVVEKSRLRSAIDVGTKIVEAAFAASADSRHVVADASQALSRMQSDTSRVGLVPAKQVLKRVFDERERRRKEGSSTTMIGLPTPWMDFNKATGGLRDGLVYIVAARPNMGKSILGVQLSSFTTVRGQRTALFSAEMTAEECMTRALACVGEIDYQWVDNPFHETDLADVYSTRLERSFEQLLSGDLVIDATSSITIDQVKARARRAHMQKPLRLIVIDHLHDMGVDPKREVRHEYGRIVQGGKDLAKEFSCPVVFLAQLNRGVTHRQDKRPTMADLRESGEIEQKADVIILLHREDYYDPNSARKGTVEAIVAKGRNIRTGQTIVLENRFSEMRMDDWIGPVPDMAVGAKSKSGGIKKVRSAP